MFASDQNSAPRQSWADLQAASDPELVNYWFGGNDDAFAAIVDRYQRLVFSVALRVVKDECEAQDVVQVVFLDVFRHMEKFDSSRGTLKVWLLQYAYSRSITWRHQLERRQFYSNLDVDDVKPSVVPAGAMGRLGFSSAETARLVEEALAQLNHKQREAIELIYFEGLRFAEAVRKTGESMAQLRHHYYRGLAKMRDFIESKRTSENMHPAPTVATAVRLEVANVKPRTV